MVLPLLCGFAKADMYWYTDTGLGEVHSFDSATLTSGPAVTVSASPLVDVGYAITAPFSIDIYKTVSGVSPLAVFTDNPYIAFVDIDPASATYNQVIDTVDMRDSAIAGDAPGVYFARFHPSGVRVYVTCLGSPGTEPSIRIAHQVAGAPAYEYDFDEGITTRKLTANPGDELEVLPDAPFAPSPAGHVPWCIDVNAGGTKVYFSCHQEGGGTRHDGVHGFTLSGSADWLSTLSVATGTAAFAWPYYVRFSPSSLPYAAGGGRCLVSNDGEPDIPGPPAFVAPGYVMTVNSDADTAVGVVRPSVAPPNIDPATFDPLISDAFWYPVGIDWTSAGGDAFVADMDQSVVAPATDGIIAARIIPGVPPAADTAFDYLDDPTPAADTDPQYRGVAVDNDNEEIVFCDLGASTPAPGSLVVYALDGTVTGVLTLGAGTDPRWISVQSGTGSSGGGGGGGGSSGSGASDTNDNGGNTFDDDDDNGSSGGGSHKKKCGLTGFEIPVLIAGWIALRRAGKAVKS
jgi:hypothetical protein